VPGRVGVNGTGTPGSGGRVPGSGGRTPGSGGPAPPEGTLAPPEGAPALPEGAPAPPEGAPALPEGGPGEPVPVLRRSPYGANPDLGRHGVQARTEILAAARRLFGERGYHGTTVEAIGEATGRSGASVYQYFEGKGQIFQVLIDELSTDVVGRARALGARESTQPTPAGLAALRAQVAELATVMRRHSATFDQWPTAEESEPALRGSAARALGEFATALAPRLAEAGIPAMDRYPVAVAMGTLLQWAHATWAQHAPERDPAVLDDALARTVFLVLFPAAVGLVTSGTPGPAPREALTPPPRPPEAEPAEADTVPGVRRRVTPRGRLTLNRIAAAATVAFRRNGFAGTSINDIAAKARVSHGSVYTYWRDRSDLFTTLAHQAATAIADHLERNGPIDGVESGTRWLSGWLDVIERHGAVLHIWTHEVIDDPELGPLAQVMTAYLNRWLDVILCAAPTAGTLPADAAYVVLWTLLTDLPYIMWVQLGVLSRDQMLDVLTGLLVRGLLGHREAGPG
jgi:AcrR family transcriptional regulator